MDDSTIQHINRIFKNKKLSWCGNFLRYDEDATKNCYNFTFQINEIKPMISVGEWKDHAFVDVTLDVDPDTILGKLVSGEYKDIFGDKENLMRFYPIKNGAEHKIKRALKPVSNLEVVVKSIKPVLIGSKEETITEQKINNSLIRNIVKEIALEIKNDLHGQRMKNLGSYDVGMEEPIEVELYVNYPVKIKKTGKKYELLKPFDVEGEWDDDFDVIRFMITIDKDADLSMMYDFIGELNDVVTHELEHVNQTKKGYEFPEKDYKQAKRYYLQQHEIEAQVKGFKRKAKLQGRNIEEVIREYFQRRHFKKSLIDLFVERLMNHYVNKN